MTKRLEATEEEITEVLQLARLCRPILHGHPPTRQGAVIVELLSTWLAGHFVHDGKGSIDREETDKRREALLGFTVDTVRRLLPAQEEIILETKEGKRWSSPSS